MSILFILGAFAFGVISVVGYLYSTGSTLIWSKKKS